MRCLSPPAQDAERHLIHWGTGWIAPALYKLGWRFSALLNNFHCQLSWRFRANRSHWQGVLCDVLGANTIVSNNSSSSSSSSSSTVIAIAIVLLVVVVVLGSANCPLK